MEININNKKRLGVVSFYDKQGKVDKYFEYLLADLKKVLTNLVIVCNGNITQSGKEVLEKYTDRIVIREEKGYEVGAW
ncbi:rhamnan synthesis F family protein, partial [Anaerosporobacter sp.]